MKSIPVLIVFGILASFVNAFVSGQNSSDSLHCYICESEQTSACQESPDISVLTSADCKDLSYSKSVVSNKIEVINDIISKSVDGKIRGAPLLNSVLQPNGQRSGTDEMKYVCLTVTLSSDDKKGITRSCQRVPTHIKDVCDFIKQDVKDEPLKITKCRACTTNYCNSSSAAGLTFFLIFVITMNIILSK